MRNFKQLPFWKRKHGLTAGEATLLGLGIGCAVAVGAALNPPRDFSFGFLWGLLLFVGPLLAVGAYGVWLMSDPVREERVRGLMQLVARSVLLMLLIAIAGLSIAKPGLWGELARRGELIVVMCLVGLACATSMFAVVVGFGVVQLADHAVRTFRRSTKPASASSIDGVWDRELD
jgi:hypothetical protein